MSKDPQANPAIIKLIMDEQTKNNMNDVNKKPRTILKEFFFSKI
tara:strand:+ start:333 stop:464 length:132 start_codon:yes stop_codon:yes gene_type:complete